MEGRLWWVQDIEWGRLSGCEAEHCGFRLQFIFLQAVAFIPFLGRPLVTRIGGFNRALGPSWASR